MLLSYNADLLPKARMMGCIRYSQPWIHFARIIDEYILYVIRSGDLYLREDSVNWHLTAGDFFLLEPGLPHEGYEKAPCEYYYVHFTHPDMGRVADEEAAMTELAEKRRQCLLCDNLSAVDPTDPITYLPKHFHLSGSEYKAALHSAVDCYVSREEHFKRRSSAQLHTFLLDVSHAYFTSLPLTRKKGSRKSEAIAEEVLRYLNYNYTEHMTSKSISERFGGNYDYINRVFTRMTGSTIFAYVNTLRIHNAKQLIATTDLPFSEIGYLVGIEDRFYFSKLFRRLTGVSPSQYYKEVRNK